MRALTVQLGGESSHAYPSSAWPELTSEEEDEAIRLGLPAVLVAAQKEKHYREQREIQAERMAAQLFIPDTPELLYAEVQKRGRVMAAERRWRNPFALTPQNREIYRLLAMYFTGHESFETQGPGLLGMEPGSLSLQKGLILAGPAGVGKSDLMELFARNPYQPYSVVSCIEMEMEYSKKDGGSTLIERHAGLTANDYAGHYYGHTHFGTCFDDFGAEGEGVHMGKRINLMDIVLQARYRACRGPFTHLTTNASMEELQLAYDGRVLDRMIQMFNFIEFSSPTAPSLRV